MIACILVGALLVYSVGYFNGSQAVLKRMSKDIKEILKHD